MNLEEISEMLPHEVTGADMYAVCSGAWLGAVRRIIKQSEKSTEFKRHSLEHEINLDVYCMLILFFLVLSQTTASH